VRPNQLSATSNNPPTPSVLLIPKRADFATRIRHLELEEVVRSARDKVDVLKKLPTLSRAGFGSTKAYPLATGCSTNLSNLRLNQNIFSLNGASGSPYDCAYSPGGPCGGADRSAQKGRSATVTLIANKRAAKIVFNTLFLPLSLPNSTETAILARNHPCVMPPNACFRRS